MSTYDTWQSPLSGRYASQEMLQLFSPRTRASTWRQLWVWLAESQKELGLDISDEALSQLRTHITMTDDDFEKAAIEEQKRRHDVMAHVHVFGLAAPAAAGIIHWGATSCYVTDNADLIFLRDGLDMLIPKLAKAIHKLSRFALQYKDLSTLGRTHGQAAQPTTVGLRACLWLQDLVASLTGLERARSDLKFRGVKGTVGTQNSFLAIFNGDHSKVEALDQLVTKKAGFEEAYPISSQTYSRRVDIDVADPLKTFGAICENIGVDIRLLASEHELEEPFGKDQTGSSAMAYKRNPMRAERMCSIGRYLRHLAPNAAATYAVQWLERSLDDSAIRRMYIPEMFLCADALMLILDNICSGLVVYPAVIERRLQNELPFLATENILMKLVEKGGDRQVAHEHIRRYSHEASAQVKLHGKDNDLIERIKQDPYFEPIIEYLPTLLDPKSFIGRAPQQVEAFCGPGRDVEKALAKYSEYLQDDEITDLKV